MWINILCDALLYVNIDIWGKDYSTSIKQHKKQ